MRANLLRLQAEAGQFIQANPRALADGGFHGAGLQTFLSWFIAKVDETDGDKQPEPRILDEDAIELATWHSSKGREWPVVVVCGLDRAVKARLPNVELGYNTFNELSRLLEHARIEYAPAFAATESNDRFLQVAAETEARRLLYVAVTRARDKLIMEWPAYLTGKANTTYWSILAESCDLSLHQNAIRVGAHHFPCAVFEAKAEFPQELNLHSAQQESKLPIIGRRAIRPRVGLMGETSDQLFFHLPCWCILYIVISFLPRHSSSICLSR